MWELDFLGNADSSQLSGYVRGEEELLLKPTEPEPPELPSSIEARSNPESEEMRAYQVLLDHHMEISIVLREIEYRHDRTQVKCLTKLRAWMRVTVGETYRYLYFELTTGPREWYEEMKKRAGWMKCYSDG